MSTYDEMYTFENFEEVLKQLQETSATESRLIYSLSDCNYRRLMTYKKAVSYRLKFADNDSTAKLCWMINILDLAGAANLKLADDRLTRSFLNLPPVQYTVYVKKGKRSRLSKRK